MGLTTWILFYYHPHSAQSNFNLQKEMENFIERKKTITDFKKDLREGKGILKYVIGKNKENL